MKPGIYYENLNLNGKNIKITSEDPLDSSIVVSGIIKWRDWGCGQKPGLISQEVVHAFLRGTNEGSPTVHQV